jgi:hypothetical protein
MSGTRQPQQKPTKKRQRHIYLLISLLCLLILNHTSLVMAGSYKYVIINNGTIFSSDVLINNLGDNSDFLDLYLYQNTTINKITTFNTLGNTAHLQINNIGQLVWSAYDNDIFKIYLYSGSSIIPISDPNYSSDYPSINNSGQVVWIENYGDNCRLCLYENETITRIVDDNASISEPQINDNGWIIWRTTICSGGQCNSTIYLYNKVDTIPVVTDLRDNLSNIQINNKNQIAFLQHNTIKIYEEAATKSISENTSQVTYLRLNNNGSMVWALPVEIGINIFYYHHGEITQINRPGFDDYDCRINNNDQIVWTSSPTSSNTPNIFCYTNGAVSMISNNNNRNEFAKINDVGQIVWLSGSNICLATPITVTTPIINMLLED